jgi:subtilisin family serine protease
VSSPAIAYEDGEIPYATAMGSLVVVSAGNEATPVCSDPAINPAALCVGASDQMDRVAGFSNYGVRVDVVAPGVGIWSTCKLPGVPTDSSHYFCPEDGTSASAPVVSGIAALLMSMGASNVLAATIIRATAKDLGNPGYDTTYGWGRVDAAAAVAMCQQICSGAPAVP